MRFFGSGSLIGKPNTANATPLQFGTLQEVTLDFSFTVKELHGQFQFPVDIGRGTAKITGKSKQGDLDPDIFGALFFNETPSAGQVLAAINEAGSVPAATTYTITVANAATFSSDEGVYYASSGIRMRRVAAAPAAGEYAVNESTGIYTFAAADAEAAVLISYVYTSTTGGRKFTINNNLLGDAPTFTVLFSGKRVTDGTTRNATIQLNRCMSNKLALATKLEDFTIPEFDFSAMADDSGSVGEMSFTN
jgi:hypothetical protein